MKMLVTTKEAKTKYCLRLVPGEQCRAAECMAWRWFDMPFTPPRARRLSYVEIWECNEEPPRPSDIPQSWTWHPFGGGDDIAGWIEPEEEYKQRAEGLREKHEESRRGYCGLAGKPEFEF
jgi:hypothetical protein